MSVLTHHDLLGHLRPPGPGVLEPVACDSGSPATGGLHRLRGDGWTWFCKVLQHVRHWPGLALMPPEHAAAFPDLFPWRSELEMWDPAWAATMPEGLRLPQLHGIVDLGDDRLAVWMEHVEEAPTPTDVASYARTAHLLGRWNARCADPDLLATSTFPPGFALRMYVDHSVAIRGVPPLTDDALWEHPWMRPHADLRAGLLAIAPEIPRILDDLDACRQAMPHGDASPQNLLVDRGAPEERVVIDLSFRSPAALGFDLGQLLVGLTHAGRMPAVRLPEIAAAIVPAYLEGLAAEGLVADEGEVRWAFAAATLLRSGYDGFRHDLLDRGGEHARHHCEERIAMCRVLWQQYLAVAH